MEEISSFTSIIRYTKNTIKKWTTYNFCVEEGVKITGNKKLIAIKIFNKTWPLVSVRNGGHDRGDKDEQGYRCSNSQAS